MKLQLALVVTFLTSSFAFGLTSPLSKPLKILELNFNSEEVSNDSDSYVRDLRFNGLKQWVKANDPDIIFIAEAWNFRGDSTVGISLARELGYDLAYRLEMGLPKFFFDADVVLAKKELKMSGERDIKLPHSALEIGNGKTWIIEFGSVSYAVGVKLTLPNGEPLYAYGTHLIATASSDREDQAKAIDADARKRAQEDGISWDCAHVVIAGDFNSAPTDLGPQAMSSLGYEDSFGAVHPGDPSCTDCSDLTYPWFNPFTIAAGLFPSQTDEDASLRDDYIWMHSPTYKTLTSTLVFTAPYNSVWMSDHYGVFSTYGDSNGVAPPSPTHDSDGSLPLSQIVTVGTEEFLCSDISPNQMTRANPCSLELAPVVVEGARGVSIENRSDFYFEVQVDGPGYVFGSRTAALDPGEQAAFTFNTAGTFTYKILNNVESPNPYRAALAGAIQVQKTGY